MGFFVSHFLYDRDKMPTAPSTVFLRRLPHYVHSIPEAYGLKLECRSQLIDIFWTHSVLFLGDVIAQWFYVTFYPHVYVMADTQLYIFSFFLEINLDIKWRSRAPYRNSLYSPEYILRITCRHRGTPMCSLQFKITGWGILYLPPVCYALIF